MSNLHHIKKEMISGMNDSSVIVSVEILRAIIREEVQEAIAQTYVERERLFSHDDIRKRLGIGDDRLRDMIHDGTVPMFRLPNAGGEYTSRCQWRITQEDWTKALIEIRRRGMLPQNRMPDEQPL